MVKLGRTYKFFNGEYYIAKVKQIIPIDKYDAAIWLEDELRKNSNVYSRHPKVVVIIDVEGVANNLVCVKMKHKDSYCTIGGNFCGELLKK